MQYMVSKPRWMRKLYGPCIWELDTGRREAFLTFDDGPHPSLTPFVLDELAKYGAKGTFFCIGSNIERYPEIYARIRAEGHGVGNHTHDHLDGWRTANKRYYANVQQAAGLIGSRLFRPPHGHVTPFQVRRLRSRGYEFQVVMWSIMSGDFDPQTSAEQCFRNVADHLRPGSIVVLHDNDAAEANLRAALPRLLSEFSRQGYHFPAIPERLLY
ncbi:polysaccharide deacetylase family protein [Flaviaesturariibacter amylovorans]|uniref:Polysaccharide deacetylase family protein n=1 Tax=Flaviaesturariibacter amylovorans TaxID=1084520 RepID=A0ABP8GRX8_9BACT